MRPGIRYLGGDKLRTREAERRFGDVVRNEIGVEPAALTSAEAQYLLGFRDADEFRARIAKAKVERGRRLAARGIGPESGSVAEEQAPYSDSPFYSALERAVEKMPTARASADQWKATLNRTPGAKKEELEWSGVLDWLNMQQG